MTPRVRTSVSGLLVLVSALSGCGYEQEGEQYRAERAFYEANRASQRLDVNRELVSSTDLLEVADRYRAVGDTFDHALADGDTVGASESEIAVALLAARAHLAAAGYYYQAEEYGLALDVARGVRERLGWATGPSVDAQRAIARTLTRQGETEAAIQALWRLAEEHDPIAPGGDRIRDAVFNAPTQAVQLERSFGDSMRVRDAARRAERYYADVSASAAGTFPALLADLNRGSLLSGLGDWEAAVTILEGALLGYSEDVMSDVDAARIAHNLARLYLEDERDLDLGRSRLEIARERGGDGEVSAEATMTLARLAGREGDHERALELFADVVDRFEQVNLPDQGRLRSVAEEMAAREAARKAARYAPLARFSRGRILEQEGRWEEALSEYRALEATHPRRPEAFEVPFVIAAHYRKTGATELADSVLRRAGERFRELIARGGDEVLLSYRALIRVEIERSRWSAAIDAMTEFARAYPGRREAALALLDAARLTREHLSDQDRFLELVSEVETVYANSPYAEAAAKLREGS